MAISVAMPQRAPTLKPFGEAGCATLSQADKAKLLDAAATLCGSSAVQALSVAIATHEALLQAKPAAYIRTSLANGEMALSYEPAAGSAFAQEPLFRLPALDLTHNGAL